MSLKRLLQERHAAQAACVAPYQPDAIRQSKDYRDQQKTFREASTVYMRALKIARDIPPKPNTQVLATALQHTAKRDGLGWGFEHQALEQDITYRKWLKKASKRPSDLE